tara:strand:- start:1791 stop:2966 length:1176 start_codon:yes stop_codon:yes gene_type:complete
MTIYELKADEIVPLAETSFSANEIREREVQRILKDNIEVISPGTLIVSEEFGHWEESRRRIDLLGIDSEDARLVVIELKRTQDGGHMELQAVRYSAMISTMTFQQVVDAFESYLQKQNRDPEEAEELILKHLGWDEPDEESFAQDVRIVLASADFSRELTSSAMWLNERGLDITCVRLRPYSLDGRVLLDVQPVVPLPEAEDYQIKIAEKQRSERRSKNEDRGATHRIAQVIENFVISSIGATFEQRHGKMVFFLPKSWDSKLPIIGDSWKKLSQRPVPIVLWFNVLKKKKGIKLVVELGRFPNKSFRQEIVRDLRAAGFTIDKRGDRPDARYTRIQSTHKLFAEVSWEDISDSMINETLESIWNDFAAHLSSIEQVLFSKDWTKAEIPSG